MIPYATITGTLDNREAMLRHNIRLLLTPDTWTRGMRPTAAETYALDNGAWGAHQQGEAFPEENFRSMVEEFGDRCDWLVVPDIVAGGLASLDFSRDWLAWCLDRANLVLVGVQDGMTPADLAPLVGPRIGVAIGGSTSWKLRQLSRTAWGDMCAAQGAHLHALRVNTRRRIRLARWAGCHSFDGTSATIYRVNAPKIERWTNEAPNYAQGLLPLSNQESE